MKLSAKTTGFIQAIGVAAYVVSFAFITQKTGAWITTQHFPQLNPILAMILFLLTFVTSALICGAIILTKPILLFFEGKAKDAIKIILWSIAWLIVLLSILGITGLAFIIR